MLLSIVAASLVSPAGQNLAEHAFFARAGVLGPTPQAFETHAGSRVDAMYCGFLGAELSIPERLERLATLSAQEALEPWDEVEPGARIGLILVSSASLVETDAIAPARHTLATRCRAPAVKTLVGAAGAFAALGLAARWLDEAIAQAVLVLGVDSHIAPEALTRDRLRSAGPFCALPLPASEGAAAVLVARPTDARARRLEAARMLGAGTARGQGHDDDDEIVDGVALTGLIRGFPDRRVELVVGQSYVDELRTREFQLASARTARRFAETLSNETLERHTGRLGAAVGVAQLAYGMAVLRHGTIRDVPFDATFLAWAIGSDGTRGAALVEGT